jgi:hypothetical protein
MTIRQMLEHELGPLMEEDSEGPAFQMFWSQVHLILVDREVKRRIQ